MVNFPKTSDEFENDSFVLLGKISSEIEKNTTFLNSTDNNSFKPKMTEAFMTYGKNDKMDTFGEYFLRSAIFDV